MVTAHSVGATTSVLYGAGLVLAYRTAVAATTRPRTARLWAGARGLTLDARLEQQLLQQLRVQRWSCVAATLAISLITYVLAATGHASISFLSLPVLIAALTSATLTPEPRRGRVRTAALQVRSRSYFAPRRPLLLVRVLLAAALLASLVGAALEASPERELVHAAALFAGAVVLELGLRSIARRGLPDATADAQVDCAVRVADARRVVAAGLVFASFGLFLAVPPLLAQSQAVAFVASVLLQPVLFGSTIWAITLLAPLRSWQPA